MILGKNACYVYMASYRNYGTGRCGSGRPRVPSGVSPYDQKRANPGEKRHRKRILDAAMVETFHDREYSWLRDGSSCLSRFAALLSVTIEITFKTRQCVIGILRVLTWVLNARFDENRVHNSVPTFGRREAK